MIRNTTQKPKLTSTKSTTKGPTESNKTSGKKIHIFLAAKQGLLIITTD